MREKRLSDWERSGREESERKLIEEAWTASDRDGIVQARQAYTEGDSRSKVIEQKKERVREKRTRGRAECE